MIQEKLTILGELYSSKNSKKIFRTSNGKFIIAKSDRSKQQETIGQWQLKDLRNKQIWAVMMNGKTYPIRLRFKIFRSKKGRWDYQNITQNILDILVMAGYIPDDDADHVIPEYEQYEIDKIKPRVEITIP